MDTSKLGNLKFVPKPIDTVCIRPGEGPGVKITIGLVQRMAALRAYGSYTSAKDWMEKISISYTVAIATRSADTLLMKCIQNDLDNFFTFECKGCREASIGISIIRKRLFPELDVLREHSNKLIHHFDDPENRGITKLNIEEVYNYCYHLFQENIEALFGVIPNPNRRFTHEKCRKCREKS